MTDLKLDIKNMIIDALELEDISPDEIIDSDPLFVDGLGLDSIDALEIGLALQKKYGIKLRTSTLLQIYIKTLILIVSMPLIWSSS